MPDFHLAWFHYIGLALLGAFVGLFSGLFGVGGGIVIIPALILLFTMTQQTAQGISLAVMVPLAFVNAITYFQKGATKAAHIPLLIALMVGAVSAGPFASAVANRLPQNTLKTMFALFMVAVAVRIMPEGSLRSMGWLLGVLLVAIGIRLILVR
jgi:uncharacterized protein